MSDDLALIKEIAARRGVPEAQIIREGIHLAAMSNRVWDGSFDWPTFDGSGNPEALRSWILHAGSSARYAGPDLDLADAVNVALAARLLFLLDVGLGCVIGSS